MFKPLNIQCSERKQALAAHKAREDKAALDLVRFGKRRSGQTYESARDKSGRVK